MKFLDYAYELTIRGRQEPILLTRMQAEALILKLKNPERKFVIFSDYGENTEADFVINIADIVSIMPVSDWYKYEEKELTEQEEEIHKQYLKVFKQNKTKLLK